MGIGILEGRGFEERDTEGQPRAIIIDEWLARRYWPDRSPLGQRMATTVPGEEPDESDLYTVIGVVESIKQYDLTAEESGHVGAYYFTYRQRPIGFAAAVVRTAAAPNALVGPVRAAVSRIDPELPLFDVRTLEERLSESLASRRTPMILLLVFAGIALFLAVVGIYGVLAYSVAQRTKEIGIRMALGSQASNILGLILKHGLILILIGLTVGTIGAFFLVRLIQSLLFGVQPADPLVLVATAGLLGAAAVSACLIPARRATRVDPVVALVKV
jgi:putative ABC transport system permease protein